MGWSKGIVDWIERNTAFVSVPFTWNLPDAYQRCVFLSWTYNVKAGGPATRLMPEYLSEVAKVGEDVDGALQRHNPDATRTSIGCPRNCSFCAVPIIEGKLIELKDWEPKSIVCDNNLLACSRNHFDYAIDRLKPVKQVDFNQGLDARFLTKYHAERLSELNLKLVRLAWDNIKLENAVMQAIELLVSSGIPKTKIRVYVLIGFKDTPEGARYRFQTLKDFGILPNPQRYNPLDALKKDSYVGPNWTDRQLKRHMRYWSRQIWLGGISFDEYIHDKIDRRENLK